MLYPRLPSVNDWNKANKSDKEISSLLSAVYDAETLYERFDKLIALYEYCENKSGSYAQLAEVTLKVIGHIIDEQDEQQVKHKIEARKAVRAYDYSYLPCARPTLSGVSNDPYALFLENQELNEEEIKAIFDNHDRKIYQEGDILKLGGKSDNFSKLKSKYKTFNETELEAFRVTPNNNRLTKLKINGKGDSRTLSFDTFDTQSLTVKTTSFMQDDLNIERTGLYSLHVNGSLFVGQGVAPERTSSLFNRDPLLHPSYSYDAFHQLTPFMAGMIKVSAGSIETISGNSGHYQPDYQQYDRALIFFKSLGIVNNLTALTYYEPTKEGVRKFTTQNLTEIQAFVRDQLIFNDLDIRTVQAPDFLRGKLPEVYTKFQWQLAINSEVYIWRQESNTGMTNPSVATIKINQAVESFSRLAQFSNPNQALELLQNVYDTTEEWFRFHEIKKLSSRRTAAVEKLQVRILQQMVAFKFYNLIKMILEKDDEPATLIKKILIDFVRYKADFSMTYEALGNVKKSRQKPSIFDRPISDSLNSLVDNFLHSKTTELPELVRINDWLTTTTKRLTLEKDESKGIDLA
jgi:hypothetical protein